MEFQDKNLTCQDCGNEFVFTAGEQKFYAEKGFENEPKRCKDCRMSHKDKRRRSDVRYEITCAKCGNKGEVNFEPRDPTKVLCESCFKEKLAAERSAAPGSSQSE